MLAASLIALPMVCFAQASHEAPQTIALISTLGNELNIVKRRGDRASNVNRFSRRTYQLDLQSLNMAVLRGLDKALAAEEPGSRRIMLRWSTSPELAEKLRSASPEAREGLVFEALRERLGQIAQRVQWDRIEAIVPRHTAMEFREGMPGELDGVGIYIKPAGNPWAITDEDGVDRRQEFAAPDQITVNPRTGEQHKDDAYMAPFVSFDRVTLDAKTLTVISRKPQFTHTKFSDPKSNSIDITEQVSLDDIATHLDSIAEQAAYRSVRGAVDVGPVKPVSR